jgi:alanyl-tRNA synthetase
MLILLITNTREAKAFALLSEEGIAKGIQRITIVTTNCAFKAMELAHSLELEVDETSKVDESLLEKILFKNFFSHLLCFVLFCIGLIYIASEMVGLCFYPT